MIYVLLNLLSCAYVYSFIPRNFLYSQPSSLNMVNHMTKELDSLASSWYVVGETQEIFSNKLYKAKIWDHDYVFWKNNGVYYAMDDDCSHRGASLSDGKLCDNQVICPYHAYEFDKTD